MFFKIWKKFFNNWEKLEINIKMLAGYLKAAKVTFYYAIFFKRWLIEYILYWELRKIKIPKTLILNVHIFNVHIFNMKSSGTFKLKHFQNDLGTYFLGSLDCLQYYNKSLLNLTEQSIPIELVLNYNNNRSSHSGEIIWVSSLR